MEEELVVEEPVQLVVAAAVAVEGLVQLADPCDRSLCSCIGELVFCGILFEVVVLVVGRNEGDVVL